MNLTALEVHAVHHASDKLYTMNVGRFHPLDKTIQFLGDSLLFLLGVSSEIFAAYLYFMRLMYSTSTQC